MFGSRAPPTPMQWDDGTPGPAALAQPEQHSRDVRRACPRTRAHPLGRAVVRLFDPAASGGGDGFAGGDRATPLAAGWAGPHGTGQHAWPRGERQGHRCVATASAAAGAMDVIAPPPPPGFRDGDGSGAGAARTVRAVRSGRAASSSSPPNAARRHKKTRLETTEGRGRRPTPTPTSPGFLFQVAAAAAQPSRAATAARFLAPVPEGRRSRSSRSSAAGPSARRWSRGVGLRMSMHPMRTRSSSGSGAATATATAQEIGHLRELLAMANTEPITTTTTTTATTSTTPPPATPTFWPPPAAGGATASKRRSSLRRTSSSSGRKSRAGRRAPLGGREAGAGADGKRTARRRASIQNVARRWKITAADADELCAIFAAQQTPAATSPPGTATNSGHPPAHPGPAERFGSDEAPGNAMWLDFRGSADSADGAPGLRPTLHGVRTAAALADDPDALAWELPCEGGWAPGQDTGTCPEQERGWGTLDEWGGGGDGGGTYGHYSSMADLSHLQQLSI